MLRVIFSGFFMLVFFAQTYADENLVEIIPKVKLAVVGIGIFQSNARPQNQLWGAGFAIGNGQYIVTNYHLIPEDTELKDTQKRVIFVGFGKQSIIREFAVVAFSKKYDLVILKHKGPPLPTLIIAQGKLLQEGESIAFTGFPLGSVLGLYPATHQGIIASITPIATPVRLSAELTPDVISQLKRPYMVYQLDAVAYPGNSGSPVYLKSTGEVVAIINKVFVQKTKETAIRHPSGITYAIPIKYLIKMIKQSDVDINRF